MELFVVAFPKAFGIAANSIEGNDKVAVQGVAFVVVEGDTVSLIIVLKELAIDLKDLCTVAEKVRHIAKRAAVCASHTLYPCRRSAAVDGGKGNALSRERNHLFGIYVRR